MKPFDIIGMETAHNWLRLAYSPPPIIVPVHTCQLLAILTAYHSPPISTLPILLPQHSHKLKNLLIGPIWDLHFQFTSRSFKNQAQKTVQHFSAWWSRPN